MVVGVYVNMYALMKKNRGAHCRVSYENIYWSFVMYFTFFVLFTDFFVKRYIRKPTAAETKPTKRALFMSNYYQRAYDASKYIAERVKLFTFGKAHEKEKTL